MPETPSDRRRAVPPIGRYVVDPDVSLIAFSARQLFGLAAVHGTFAVRTGSVNVAEPLSASLVSAEIDTASLRTGIRCRDDAARSPRLLDAARFPSIAFEAVLIAGTTLVGTLIVRGRTRPIAVRIDRCSVSQDSFTSCGSARVDRTAFGVTAMRGLISRMLELQVEVRCVRA